MATHEVTFPIQDESEILKLRAGDEVVVQGHIIGIRDRTQIRIFDQGFEPPMDLNGAFLLHTALADLADVRGGVKQESPAEIHRRLDALVEDPDLGPVADPDDVPLDDDLVPGA